MTIERDYKLVNNYVTCLIDSLQKRLAIQMLSQDCSSGPCERNWSTWALFHTKKRNKLTTLQLERLVFCNCNLKLIDRLTGSPKPTQMNIDKIDIEKVRDIPDIPQEERDLYALLYEEAIAPVHNTRGSRGQAAKHEAHDNNGKCRVLARAHRCLRLHKWRVGL